MGIMQSKRNSEPGCQFFLRGKQPFVWLRTQLPGTGSLAGSRSEPMRLSLNIVSVLPFSSPSFHPATSLFSAHLFEVLLFQASGRMHLSEEDCASDFPITIASLQKEIALMGVSYTAIAKGIAFKSYKKSREMSQ